MARRVDVIIPVYGAADDLARCLASVRAHTDLDRHRLVLVVDGPQDVDTGDAHVLRNETRLGFAASVNRGMRASSNDVVLLNSDTIVTARWLEKLIEAAGSADDIGTVTPLSNNATLCSVPRAFEENLIPTGYDVDSYAEHIESTSSRRYPRIPTGVGFCMYIKRALIDDIGLFDAESFADGYGEENDFCMRALARGWVHVADDATFVFHAGHRSFGATRKARMGRGAAVLRRKYPQYMGLIAEEMRRRGRRLHIEEEHGRIRVAHLVHGWPPFDHGGTELYAYWLAMRQRASHGVSVYARMADPSREEGEAVELLDRGVRVRLVTNNFTPRDPLRRNAIRDRRLERDFEKFLREERPHVLHIHHLGGHAFSLARVARKLRIPIVQQIQDWWFVCARVNQTHRDGSRCSGPAPAKCANCATLTNVPMMNRAMHAIRRSAARDALRAADAFIVGSNAIRDDYRDVVPRATPFHVIPYGVAIEPSREKRAPAQRPIRFGFVGSLAPHKGVQTAIEAIRGVADATLHIWGDGIASDNIVFEGRFKEEDKPRVFASMDVLVVPSIGLESFGLTAREAMASGVPVIATSGGALSEMFEPGTCGEFFPPGDAAALRAIVERVIDDPSIIDRWRERLPQPKRDDVHAEEIERVYRSVLER